MKRWETGKKIIALALTVAMAMTLLPVTGLEGYAKTEMLMDDFDDELKFDIETIQYTPKKKV